MSYVHNQIMEYLSVWKLYFLLTNRAAYSRGLFWRTVNNSDGNGGVPVPAERRPRVRAAVLHAAQQGARPPAQVTHTDY